MKVLIPSHCPICNSELERVNMQLFCRNDSCEGRSNNRINSYCKKIKIKGLAEKSIEKLNIESIADLYSLDKESLVSILGKNGEKIYMEIQRSLNTDINTLIGSLGIPLVGLTTAKKLKADSIFNIDYSGLPNKASENFKKFLQSDLYDDLCNIPFNFEKKEDAAKEQAQGIVAITGKFPIPKREIEEKLNELGYIVVDTISKKVNLLVTNDKNSTSSKMETARKYNIEIKTLEEIIK